MTRKSPIKGEIYKLWNDSPELSPKEIRASIVKKIGDKRSKNGAYPGLRLVQKYIAEFIEKSSEISHEDRPWTLAALAKYPINPEALPIVVAAWERILSFEGHTPIRYLSIREAKWIANLHILFPFKPESLSQENIENGIIPKPRQRQYDEYLLDLIKRANGYAIQERSLRIVGDYPEQPKDFLRLWLRDASELGYEKLADKIQDIRKEIFEGKKPRQLPEVDYFKIEEGKTQKEWLKEVDEAEKQAELKAQKQQPKKINK